MNLRYKGNNFNKAFCMERGTRSLHHPTPRSTSASAPPYPTPPQRFFGHHLTSVPYPLKPRKNHSHRLTKSCQWAGMETRHYSPCLERHQRKPPPFSAQRQNLSIPALHTPPGLQYDVHNHPPLEPVRASLNYEGLVPIP